MRLVPIILLAAAVLGQEAPTRLDKANTGAVVRIKRTFARSGKSLDTQLKGLRKEDVIVVGGLFDFVQELLVAYRVPHTVVTPAELEHLPMAQPERMIFFLNCHLLDRKFPGAQPKSERPTAAQAQVRLEQALKAAGLTGDSAPGKAIRDRFKEVMYFAGSDYSETGLKRMGTAIRKGAWAMSNDWAVLALEKALPGTIRWTGHRTYEETVEVQVSATGRRHALMKDVFPKKGKPKLWLETESYLFRIKGRYRILIESRALGARYGGNRNVVALIEPGKGKVLHSLAHTYLQRGREDDAAVMQRLLVNFMIAKSLENYTREWEAKQKKK